MALTNFFVSVPGREPVPDMLTDSAYNTGTSSTSTDFVELRVMTNDGSNPTNITRLDVLKILEAFERFIENGGKLGTDANLPVR